MNLFVCLCVGVLLGVACIGVGLRVISHNPVCLLLVVLLDGEGCVFPFYDGGLCYVSRCVWCCLCVLGVGLRSEVAGCFVLMEGLLVVVYVW